MGKPTGFQEFVRLTPDRRPVQERTNDYGEYYQRWSDQQAKEQGSR